MLFYFIYFCSSPILYFSLIIFKFFNSKIHKHLKYEKSSINQVVDKLRNNNKKVILFHAASAGEFEQLKPILSRLDRSKYFIIQSFTSPTIYDIESKNNLFDIACYHPIDLWWRAFSFFSKIKPSAYIITRHDLWPAHLFIARILKIKILYINANLHEKSIWLKPGIKAISKAIFKNIDYSFVPSERIQKKLESIYLSNKIIITGDSRFDQIIDRQILNSKKQFLPSCFMDSFNIIFGSYDKFDEEIIFNSLIKTYKYGDKSLVKLNHRIILVPHEIDVYSTKKMISILEQANFKPKLLSEISKDNNLCNLLIIDKIGILADIYKYCKLAYVGSGFSDGVHSVIEPGIYGCAVSYGPNIELLDEAIHINQKNIGIMVRNENDLYSFLQLYSDIPKINNYGNQIKKYILSYKNVSGKIIKLIESKI